MAFADLAKKHASFVAAHGPAETIEFRDVGAALWQSFSAHVIRNPVDALGQALRNTIDVYLSRDNVPAVRVLSQLVRLPTEEGKPRYRVEEVLGEHSANQGHWLVRCTK